MSDKDKKEILLTKINNLDEECHYGEEDDKYEKCAEDILESFEYPYIYSKEKDVKGIAEVKVILKKYFPI